MQPDEAIPHNLSENPTESSLTALIGEDLFAKLSSILGGRRLYIPHNPGEQSPIAVAIGLDAAQKISHVYGGMQFEVALSSGRKAKVRQLLAEGVSVYKITNTLGCSRFFVRTVKNEIERKNQLDLFSKE